MLLAEGLHHGLDLVEVVAGHHWEEVVLDLVVEAPGEPGHEDGRVDGAAGEDLEAVKVHVPGLLHRVNGHAVVVERKDGGQEHAARELAGEQEEDLVEDARAEEDEDGEEPDVVEGQAESLNLVGGEGSPPVMDVKDGLHEPREAGKGEEGGVEEDLVVNKELGERLLRLGVGEPLEGVLRPGEEGEGVNVRVATVDVWDGVVGVVLVLPPVTAEALGHSAEQVAGEGGGGGREGRK